MNVELLRVLIRNHQSETPTTLQSLAQKAGIAEKTLKRILTEDFRPSDHTVFKVTQAIFGKRSKDLFNFLLEYKNGDLNRLRDIFAACEIDLDQSDKLNRFIATSQTHYRVVALLTHDRGISQAEIEKNLGVQGIKTLEDLVEQGFAKTSPEGRFRLSNRYLGQFNGSILKSILSQCIQMYDVETFGTEASQIGHVQQWVSEDGRKQVRQALFELMSKIVDISKQHPGNIPITTLTSMISLIENGIEGAQ